jgi:hypothetical protein
VASVLAGVTFAAGRSYVCLVVLVDGEEELLGWRAPRPPFTAQMDCGLSI